MARVICKLPNASGRISGVAFAAHDGAMLSEEIGDEHAAEFCRIPGYELLAPSAPAEKAEEAEAPAAKTDGKRPRGRAAVKSDD